MRVYLVGAFCAVVIFCLANIAIPTPAERAERCDRVCQIERAVGE